MKDSQPLSRRLPENAGYDELAHRLVPPTWPPAPEVEAGIAAFVAAHGERALQTAISAGQHAHTQGLFYGGRNPTWSNQMLRHVLQEHGTQCARLGWIELHTGLGPSGHGERIFAGRDEAAALSRARAWWGADVTSMYDGSSTSAQLTGLMCSAAYEECAQAEYTGIALEYGTVPLREVVNALRADQRLENHPETAETTRLAIKRQVRDTFYTDTEAWKARIVEQGLEAARQAVAGLGGSWRSSSPGECSNMTRSCASSSILMIRSTPPTPSTTGAPPKVPATPSGPSM